MKTWNTLSIRTKILIVLVFSSITISLVFSYIFYTRQKDALISGIDQKLQTAATIIRYMVPPDFHDKIENANSISLDEFTNIVNKYNLICKKLGFQYLWSVIKVGDNIHFTTATSPDKIVANNKHAKFFQIHKDPHAFDSVFESMKPTYSEFKNEWGHGRMLLVPFLDSKGRKYCFGASISIEEVDAMLQRTIVQLSLICLAIFVLSVIMSFAMASNLSRPIIALSRFAKSVSSDTKREFIFVKGSEELVSLSESINIMNNKLHDKIYALVEENEKRRLYEEELKIARDKAEKASKVKSEFLANISHEIRTPLNSVIGFSELLKGMNLEPKSMGYIQGIYIAANTLLSLINDILDLSKLEVDKLQMNMNVVSIRSVLSDLIVIFELKAKEKNLDFTVQISDSIPEYCMIDEIRLRQIVLNLLGNAFKFTEKGSVTLLVKAGNFSHNKEIFDLSISFIDTGIGISKEEIDNIFEPFTQHDSLDTKKYGGTGLGLAITKKICKLLNGTIQVDSKLGEGSTFVITLPKISVSKNLPPIVEDKIEADIDFEGKTILIVEDIDSNREVIKKYLSKTNLHILEAKNGKNALEKVKKNTIDLILLDLQMPVMDGFEVIRQLQATKETSNIPIIVLSANSKEEIDDIDGYLQKPIQKSLLYKELKKCIANKKSAFKEVVLIPPNLQEEFTKEFSLTYKTIKRYMLNTEIEEFALSVKKFASERKLKDLEAYAESLYQYTSNLDIARMQKEFIILGKYFL